MPKYVQGWIEVQSNDMWWNGVIKIDKLTLVAPEVTSILFDVDNLEALVPVAARRGLPRDKSLEVEESFNQAAAFAETWITPEEIRNIFKIEKVKEGYALIFHIINDLVKVYGKNKVRLVVWFS
jgi:hypothetical protein